LRARDQVTTSIVATAGTAIPDLTTHRLLLTEVDEESVVQTRFATTTLALLRATLGEDLTGAIRDASAVLAEDPATALAGVADAEQVTFVGRGWTVGLANEAALKLRESAQFWTESYPAMEYRHGPISIATTGRATWAFGEVPEGLAGDVAATGAHFEHRDIDPMADLLRVHRLCLAKAERAGVDPDRPRHLSRSIILS
jgi:fructoselysine-6-P-deglycase FrlB-like protein